MNERMDRRRFVAAVGGAALTASAPSFQGQIEEREAIAATFPWPTTYQA